MNKEKLSFNLIAFSISLLITLGIGGIAAFFTTRQIKVWYIYLNKPSFNPPNWLFGPVWTILYIMIAIAAYLVWQKRNRNKIFESACVIYFIQLSLNFSWSIIFFGFHQILIALVAIMLLFVSIIININAFSKFSKTAGRLLVPYLLWVGFAGVLNLSIWWLNK